MVLLPGFQNCATAASQSGASVAWVPWSTDHDLGTQLAPGLKACVLRCGTSWPQILLGPFPQVGPLVPFPQPRPHQQKQGHSHQDGTTTHSCQAQEMECPAPSPLHQEHLQGETGLGRGPRGTGSGRGGWVGGWQQPSYVKPVVMAIPEASSYRDQGEDCVHHSSSYGGIGGLPYPCRLEDAG